MKVYISTNGQLVIESESSTETYALKQWKTKSIVSVNRSEKFNDDIIEIKDKRIIIRPLLGIIPLKNSKLYSRLKKISFFRCYKIHIILF